jgi:hypothetical protein
MGFVLLHSDYLHLLLLIPTRPSFFSPSPPTHPPTHIPTHIPTPVGFLTNDYTPTGRGFDRYLGYYSGAEEHFTHLKKGATGYIAYDLANNTGPDDIAPCLAPVGNGTSTYSAYLYV